MFRLRLLCGWARALLRRSRPGNEGGAAEAPSLAPGSLPDPPRPLDLQAVNSWHALPGYMIELGTTGYQIRLNQHMRQMPYSVTDPDGRLVAVGGDLAGLKAFAENLARQRAEFTCSAPWQLGGPR